jgi:hypothetical protein
LNSGTGYGVRFTVSIAVILLAAVFATGCGETISADERIERCLSKQPDATKADCEKWESDGQLKDNGTHEGHDNM